VPRGGRVQAAATAMLDELSHWVAELEPMRISR
jgi:hypothetical protein